MKYNEDKYHKDVNEMMYSATQPEYTTLFKILPNALSLLANLFEATLR
jgi:hypothetical protein